MKKIVLTLAALLTLSATAMAAPINDLGRGQTALGVGTDTVYLEHKLTDSFTLGFENVDRYSSMNDVYGQFQLSDNFRGIVGSRDLYGDSKLYVGAAVNAPLSHEWDGYASVIGGSNFNEVQVGANLRLASNIDLNVDYHSFSPDYGRSKSGVGVGATVRF